MKRTPTYREMCERIAAKSTEHGLPLTWEQVWTCSPTGELWPIWEMYCLMFPDHVTLSDDGTLSWLAAGLIKES